MGLGKTIQVIRFLHEIQDFNQNKTLIVAPKAQWKLDIWLYQMLTRLAYRSLPRSQTSGHFKNITTQTMFGFNIRYSSTRY